MSENKRGTIIEVHISDIHFGAFDPKVQYNILREQFLDKINQLPRIDLISIDGDLFDRKFLANSEPILYANTFVQDVVNIAKSRNATTIILAGTPSHDSNQERLYYHYLEDPTIDVRIVDTIKFETVNGCRILCIPELHSVDESVYQNVFFNSGWYDEAFIHGTYQGAAMSRPTERLFTASDFIYLTGPAISGHVHTGGCFNGFYYYNGCPYRWRFGEEEDKGFLILAHDLDTGLHYVQFEKIESFRYDTIYLDELLSNDPREIVEYINKRQIEEGIDYIKVRFRVPVDGSNKTIINNYFRNNNRTKVEFMDIEELEEHRKQELLETETRYSYLMDPKISDMERFVRYINESEGNEFITVEKLTELLKEI